MAVCLTCNTHFHGDEQFCPRDGTPLQAQAGGDRLVGRVLSGRYRLIDLLGQGGMGSVYRAHQILMDKPVALKVLRQELASDAEAVARFHREARSASRLDHEHIIRVMDFGQSDDGLLFLVMELLDGESLAEVVLKGPLPWPRAASLALDVARGLAHAHDQGIVHRDLKPENIILARRPRSTRLLVKVLDFGLAKLMHEAAPDLPAEGAIAAPPHKKSLTRTGVVFGTPEYMSPEQAEGLALDHRTDIYGLGVLLYQMVTGEVPFTGATFLALITRTVQEAPVPPSQKRPGLALPVGLEALILRCLEKSPAGRPQSAEMVADELEHICLEHPEAVSDPGRRLALSGAGPSGPDLTPVPVPVHAYAATLGLGRSDQTPVPPAREPSTPPRGARGARGGGDPLPIDEPSAASPPAPWTAQHGDGDGEGDATMPNPLSDELVLKRGRAGRVLLWAAAVLCLMGSVGAGVVFVLPRYFYYKPPPASSPAPVKAAERDVLGTAQQLLAEHRVDEALVLLQEERQQRNSPVLQRLLSAAYEAKKNRLRALGHMVQAVSLSHDDKEGPQSHLALAQLLSRMGHPQEACHAAQDLLATHPAPEHKGPAEALVHTLRCPHRPPP